MTPHLTRVDSLGDYEQATCSCGWAGPLRMWACPSSASVDATIHGRAAPTTKEDEMTCDTLEKMTKERDAARQRVANLVLQIETERANTTRAVVDINAARSGLADARATIDRQACEIDGLRSDMCRTPGSRCVVTMPVSALVEGIEERERQHGSALPSREHAIYHAAAAVLRTLL